MFLFFSNRLGCAGSLLVSLAITALLLLIFVFEQLRHLAGAHAWRVGAVRV
jgi:hypothetical protein